MIFLEPTARDDTISEQDPPQYGSAFKHFGSAREGREACEALYALCQMGSLDTTISNFLQPLQVCKLGGFGFGMGF